MDGTYQIDGLRPGTYSVVNLVGSGYTRAPSESTGSHVVVLSHSNATSVRLDFAFTRLFPSWQNQTNVRDVDRSGLVVPLDVLVVINELNGHAHSLSESGELPERTSDLTFLYDVNGDDFASPLDALIIINFLNGSAAGEGTASDASAGASISDSAFVIPRSFVSLLAAGLTSPTSEIESGTSLIAATAPIPSSAPCQWTSWVEPQDPEAMDLAWELNDSFEELLDCLSEDWTRGV